jgi:methylthioribulose-1-phosphate dehydratase
MPDGRVAITVSGRDKSRLSADDIMLVDSDGNPLGSERPSAETALHIQVYRRRRDVGAVVHPHAVSAVVLSRDACRELRFAGYEILKALPGFTSHHDELVVPVFANDQDVDRLAAVIDEWMLHHAPTCGYVIAQHGFYTFGVDVSEALRHAEALDHLFQCELAWRWARR